MRVKPAFRGGIDAREHRGKIVAAGDLVKAFAVEGVEMDVQAAKPASYSGFGLVGQQDGVGGEREVADARNRGDRRDQIGRSRRSRGSPPVSADLVDAQGTATRHKRSISSKSEFAARGELGPCFGHAVEAADIAAVGDADAQIGMSLPKRSTSAPESGAGASGSDLDEWLTVELFYLQHALNRQDVRGA